MGLYEPAAYREEPLTCENSRCPPDFDSTLEWLHVSPVLDARTSSQTPFQASAIADGESQAQCDERSCKRATHPGQYTRMLDDTITHGSGEESVEHEDDEGDDHEDRAESEHLRDGVR